MPHSVLANTKQANEFEGLNMANNQEVAFIKTNVMMEKKMKKKTGKERVTTFRQQKAPKETVDFRISLA